MSRSFVAIGAVCLAAIGTGWNAVDLKDTVNPPHPVAGLDVNDTSASASLLGQFRTNTSSWLWLRTDLYLHNGVELRPMTTSERQAGQAGVGSSDKDLNQALNEDYVVTSIPSPNRDFRGWLGDLERATAPYKDMHNHTHNNPEQALPLFRLMTWIDPNFVEGWTVGATVIARDHSDRGTEKSIDFLNEGLKANPESVAILNEIAFMNITRQKDLVTAAKNLERARISGLKDRKLMSSDDLDEFAQTYRWLSLCYRDLNEPEQENAILKEGHALFPNDAVLDIIMDPAPKILTPYGKKIWEQKHTQAAQQKTERTESDAHDLK